MVVVSPKYETTVCTTLCSFSNKPSGWNSQCFSLFYALGYIAYRQGDYERARDLNISCLEQMIEIGWRHGTVDTLWNLAGPLTWLGEEEKAVRLLGASAALLVEMGVAPHPSDIRELSLYTADARAQLDEAVFETLYAEGWAMTVEQAIDYALET